MENGIREKELMQSLLEGRALTKEQFDEVLRNDIERAYSIIAEVLRTKTVWDSVSKAMWERYTTVRDQAAVKMAAEPQIPGINE